jgi:hypothetical protein
VKKPLCLATGLVLLLLSMFHISGLPSFASTHPGAANDFVPVGASNATTNDIVTATPPPPPVPPYIAPESVRIDGPSTSLMGVPVPFSVEVSPITATLPITYEWQTTDGPDLTEPHVYGHQLWQPFAWDDIGTKAVTLTVSNIAGQVVGTRTITILPNPDPPVQPKIDYIATSGAGFVGEPVYLFIYVGPSSVTFPITYTLEATDFTPTITARSVVTAYMTELTWSTPGIKNVTIMVSNLAGAAHNDWTVYAQVRSYLSLLLR